VVSAERGIELADADFVETLCRGAIAPGSGEAGPAHQIAYQQCPDCRRATQNGAGRQIDVAPEVLERAACDARVIGSLDAPAPERATTTVTPRLREQVFARDHRRCTVPGCRAARNLDVHHIIEQSRGGKHQIWNMTLLCSGHHAALHAGLLEMTGHAPYEIEFRWVHGQPMPAALDPAEREAFILQAAYEVFGAPYVPDEDPRPKRVSQPGRHGATGPAPGIRPASRDRPTTPRAEVRAPDEPEMRSQ
jgi:hypothetical protein